MKNIKHKEHGSEAAGYSVIETLVTMSIFFVILFGVYIMIVHYGNATKTEQARMTIQQENRFIGSVFSEELKDAGSVLTLAHTGGFLGGTPSFNGLQPLNNDNFPDGVILATGDPEAVTALSQDLSSGTAVLNVESAIVPASLDDPDEYPAWAPGDIGIVLSKDGYYVFSVEEADTGGNTLTMRSDPVYYSGQLLTTNYYDYNPSGTTGNNLTYPTGSMVARLSNFAIYLFKESVQSKTNRQVRQLIRVSDTKGAQDVLADGSAAETSVISENIWDMQIAYVAFEDFSQAQRTTAFDPNHHYFAGGSTSTDLDNLLKDIKERKLKQIDISIVTLTDTYGGLGETQASLPQLGDRISADTIPKGKFGLKVSSFSVEPRNFNIIL
jgi:hypothetical protein